MAYDVKVGCLHDEIVDYFVFECIIFEFMQSIWSEAFHMIPKLTWPYLDGYQSLVLTM